MCYKKISCLRVACFLTPIFLVGDHLHCKNLQGISYSSVAEQRAVNPEVAGSNPAGRALLFYKEVHIMNFSIK